MVDQTQNFISKANIKHTNKYTYVNCIYKNINTKVIITCSIHGNFLQSPRLHLRGSGCQICADTQRKETNLRKYGTNTPLQSNVIQAKTKETNLRKYGVDKPFKSHQIQTKIKQTNFERYNAPSYRHTVSGKEKVIETCINKYGVEHPWKSPSVREKIKQTNLEKYGVLYPQQHTLIREKTQYTNLNRRGVLYNWSKNSPIRNQLIQQCISQFGVNYPNQCKKSHIIKMLMDYNWLFDQYCIQHKTADQISRDFNISATTVLNYLKRHEIQIKQLLLHSVKQIQWLNLIAEKEGFYIQHAGNIGEYKIPGTRYRADGYCLDTNTIYEFHGDYWHGNPKRYNPDRLNVVAKKSMNELYQKTIKKENKIRELGYNLIVMWESDFLI
ncbi:MAG: DUF7487 domain-containing protein [Nitrososphaeraceae archaeon]